MRSVFKKFLLFLILIFIVAINKNYARSSKLDSLKTELSKVQHDTIKVQVLEKIAGLHTKNSNYLKSIEAYLEAVKIYIALGDKVNEAEMYNYIGSQYYYLQNWDQAIQYWTEALKISNELNSIEDQARFINNIGLIYEKRGDYKKALEYQTKALIIKQEIGDSLSISRSFNNIAMIYERTNQNDKAIEYYKKSLRIKRNSDDNNGLIIVLQNLGYAYYHNDNYKLAIKYVNESLDTSKVHINIDQQQESLAKMGDIYDAMGNYKQANTYLKLAANLEDSIMQINNRELIAEMDAKFETEKKDNEITFQQIEIEKRNAELKLQATEKLWFAIGLFLALILFFVAYWGFKQKQTANLILEDKNAIIEEKNKDITDSITYASNIQQSILPDSSLIRKLLPNHFIYLKPKDIVSGDFYWFHEKEDRLFIMAADCTGHGVPGAFVSMLCNNALNQVIIEKDFNDPGEILTEVNKTIKQSLKKKDASFTSSDGMDCSLCVIEKKTKKLVFAGAYNQLVYITNKTINEIKADRTPIGGRTDNNYHFTSHEVDVSSGANVYLFSDGYADQFGGPKGKKFMVKKLKNMFLKIHELPYPEQKEHLDDTLNKWEGNNEQVDDILVIGFKV